MRFADVARPHTGGEAEGGVVALCNRFGQVVERNRADDGAGDFFLSDARPVVNTSEDRWPDEEAIRECVARSFAAAEGAGFLIGSDADVAVS